MYSFDQRRGGSEKSLDVEMTSLHSSEERSQRPEEESDQEEDQPPPYSAFSPGQRRLIVGVVSAAAFFGPLTGAIYLPAIPLMQDVFSVKAEVINATVSVYMVVFAIAPLIWSAFADSTGRKTIYLASLLLFIIVNILLAGVPPNIIVLFLLRVCQAIGASGVTSIGAGTVADITEPRNRAFALSIFLIGPQASPFIGPVIGGPLSTPSKWRWIFGFLAISCSAVYILILFCLPETLRSLVGDGSIYANKGWIQMPRLIQRPVVDPLKYPSSPRPTAKTFLRLLRYPPTFIICFTSGIIFAAYYAIAVTFPSTLKEIYGFNSTEVGLSYLAPGFALIFGSVFGGKLCDMLHARTVKRDNGKKVPEESRIGTQIYAFAFASAGLLLYGWFCQYRIHVAAVLASSVLTGFGMTWTFVTATAYQTECSPSQAASLVALAGLFRWPSAAVAAAIIDQLIQKMGIGWCFTGFAVVNLLGVPGVLVTLKWGPEWRKELEERERKGV